MQLQHVMTKVSGSSLALRLSRVFFSGSDCFLPYIYFFWLLIPRHRGRCTYLVELQLDPDTHRSLFELRKYLLWGYLLGELTHTTVWVQAWSSVLKSIIPSLISVFTLNDVMKCWKMTSIRINKRPEQTWSLKLWLSKCFIQVARF